MIEQSEKGKGKQGGGARVWADVTGWIVVLK